MSVRLLALDLWLRATTKRRLGRSTSVPEARARMEREAANLPMPAGARWRDAPLAGLPARRLDPPADGAGMLLWLHGGAYCLGSPATHSPMLATLALPAGVGAVLPAYRLAPEAPFPAAVEDAAAAWAALRAEGWPAARIVLGGDSAGGGLAFAVLHQLLAAGEPPPAGVVAFCPWADLTLGGASLRRLAWRDALLPARRIAEVRDLYLAGADPRDPRASPVFGRFQGAPPVLIQASTAEILLDDACLMAARLRAQGAEVELDLWNRVPHVWQGFAGVLPEADAALARAAKFVAARLSLNTP
jgi:epsilon-lactone hydrolase